MAKKDKTPEFTWCTGRQLYNLSLPTLNEINPFFLAYEYPAFISYSFVKTQPLGLPVVPDVYKILDSNLAFIFLYTSLFFFLFFILSS